MRPGVFVPLARDPLERLARGFEVGLDPQLLGDARVMPLAELGIGLVPLGARIGERHPWIGPERHPLMLAVELVAPAPEFASRGRHQQEEPVAVGELVRFGPRLGCADLRVGEHSSASRNTSFFGRAYLVFMPSNHRMGTDEYGRLSPH